MTICMGKNTIYGESAFCCPFQDYFWLSNFSEWTQRMRLIEIQLQDFLIQIVCVFGLRGRFKLAQIKRQMRVALARLETMKSFAVNSDSMIFFRREIWTWQRTLSRQICVSGWFYRNGWKNWHPDGGTQIVSRVWFSQLFSFLTQFIPEYTLPKLFQNDFLKRFGSNKFLELLFFLWNPFHPISTSEFRPELLYF